MKKNSKTTNNVSKLLSLEKNYNNDPFVPAVCAAYILYLAQKNSFTTWDCPDFFMMQKMIPDFSLCNVISKLIGNHFLDVYAKLINVYSETELRDFILSANSEEESLSQHSDEFPSAINSLLLKILDLKAKEEVADFCCNTGKFMISACMEQPSVRYTGFANDTDKSILARIRADVLQNHIAIKTDDLLQTEMAERFDKILCFSPGCTKITDKRALEKLIAALPKSFPGFSGRTSSDWTFVLKTLVSLKQNGTAVVVMPLGTLENQNDRNIRKFLLERGFIKAVIALPEKLFFHTNCAACILILQKNNHEHLVRMIDASELKQTGRRRNVMTDEHVAEIINLLHGKEQLPNARSVDYRDIIIRGYMNPVKYLQLEIPMENGVPFQEITSSIRRGAMLRAGELDHLICTNPTEFQYLTLKDISEGRINKNLACLKEISPRFFSVCLKDCDLVISKLGNPFKIAIARVPENKKILVSGNFYIITIDQKKANPYYIKAFLESKKGSDILLRIASGSFVPGLAIGDLENMMIPLPSLEEQDKIAVLYREKSELIESLHHQLELAEQSLKSIFS